MQDTQNETAPDAGIPAAAYVRMSTEHQRYSADNQLEAINAYAAERGFEVAVVYADLGRSGVSLNGRPGLQQLLRDIEAGEAIFRALLVYDVSRWGRFQDPDEAAACELSCRRAGVSVHYCAEHFENDGSVSSSILKALKRVMAGEYSRELSVKVYRGQANLVRRGFHVGGEAPYGLRRVVVDEAGRLKGRLGPGQRKGQTTDRVMLVPGPVSELKVVRQIFRLYLEGCTRRGIARILNEQLAPAGGRRRWSDISIRCILGNAKYMGQNIWGRSSIGLGTRARVQLPADQWLRSSLQCRPIISPRRFQQVQEEMARRARRPTDEEMLSALTALLQQTGRLSRRIIDSAQLGFSASDLRRRFNGMVEAYRRIGYEPEEDYSAIPVFRQIRAMQTGLRADLAQGIRSLGLACSDDGRKSRLQIQDSLHLLFFLMRPYRLPTGGYRWRFRKAQHAPAELYVLGRISPSDIQVQDYYVISAEQFGSGQYLLDDANSPELARFRFSGLDSVSWQLAQYPSIMLPAG